MSRDEWLALWDEEHLRAEEYQARRLAEEKESQEFKDHQKRRREEREQDAYYAFAVPIHLGNDVGTNQPVTVTAEELCSGTYLLGTQGAGKSSLLEHIAYQRMQHRDSVLVLDPHGQLIDNIVARMPASRLQDTYVLDLREARSHPFSLNIFHCADPTDEIERARTRGRVLRVFRRLWPEIESGQYVEKLLRIVTTTLLYNPGCTLSDVPQWLRKGGIPEHVSASVHDADTRTFWEHDFPALSDRDRASQAEPFLNRVRRLLADDLLRRLLCHPAPPLDIAAFVTQRRSLLVQLPVDAEAVGEAASLTGVALFSLLYSMTFDDTPKESRHGYTLIVDEFHNFVTSDFVRLFVGGRKYGAKLVLAHQYSSQLDLPGLDANRRGVLTAHTVIAFHTTPHDAVEVAPLYAQLETVRARGNLAADVTHVLKHHPAEVVKEFAIRHVEPLIQASRAHTFGRIDFGWGSCQYWPDEASPALFLLNQLLYDSEKTGRVADAALHNTVRALAEIFHPSAAGKIEHELTSVLRSVLAALIQDPIVERQQPGADSVVAQLPSLPSRRAFVKTGDRAHIVETQPLPDPVQPHIAASRRKRLIHQTHREYCSMRSIVDEHIAASPSRHQQVQEPTPSRITRRSPKKRL